MANKTQDMFISFTSIAWLFIALFSESDVQSPIAYQALHSFVRYSII